MARLTRPKRTPLFVTLIPRPAYKDGTLVVNVTNRHRDQPMDAVIELEDKRFNGNWQASEVNGPDIKAENNFNTTTVKTATKSASPSGTTLKYTLPPHSFTMLKGSVA